mmetsp:Transcript_43294/g.97712  ORF Transcript_43294/g.97712 Transcript_43294/m.97712 type:complete len:237 (-) Transcript_43294:409-1119(-)
MSHMRPGGHLRQVQGGHRRGLGGRRRGALRLATARLRTTEGCCRLGASIRTTGGRHLPGPMGLGVRRRRVGARRPGRCIATGHRRMTRAGHRRRMAGRLCPGTRTHAATCTRRRPTTMGIRVCRRGAMPRPRTKTGLVDPGGRHRQAGSIDHHRRMATPMVGGRHRQGRGSGHRKDTGRRMQRAGPMAMGHRLRMVPRGRQRSGRAARRQDTRSRTTRIPRSRLTCRRSARPLPWP